MTNWGSAVLMGASALELLAALVSLAFGAIRQRQGNLFAASTHVAAGLICACIAAASAAWWLLLYGAH
ncbi:MAG TPA: hypothetical protein VMV29_22800 [Ktedonobacterales bacterium]|nr:hypothetical protein [Ktedonobacterales bacterium]